MHKCEVDELNLLAIEVLKSLRNEVPTQYEIDLMENLFSLALKSYVFDKEIRNIITIH